MDFMTRNDKKIRAKPSGIAVCLGCGQILHSKHVHDCVFCLCDNQSMLDGGTEYTRKGGKNLELVKSCLTIAEARRISATVKDKPRYADLPRTSR